jgi:hypothetical protein
VPFDSVADPFLLIVSDGTTNGSPKEVVSMILIQLSGYETRSGNAEKPSRKLRTLPL